MFKEVDKTIADFLLSFECTLNIIPSVRDTIVSKPLSDIRDIRRFSSADKKKIKFLVNFAGNDLFSCHSDNSAIVQGFTEESCFLCILSKADEKR